MTCSNIYGGDIMKSISIRRVLKLARVARKDPSLAIEAAGRFGWLDSSAIKRFSYTTDHHHEIEFPAIGSSFWHSEKRKFPQLESISDMHDHLEAAIQCENLDVVFLLNSRKKHQISIVVKGDCCSIQEKIGPSIINASGICHNRLLCMSSILCIGHIPEWFQLVSGKKSVSPTLFENTAHN